MAQGNNPKPCDTQGIDCLEVSKVMMWIDPNRNSVSPSICLSICLTVMPSMEEAGRISQCAKRCEGLIPWMNSPVHPLKQ